MGDRGALPRCPYCKGITKNIKFTSKRACWRPALQEQALKEVIVFEGKMIGSGVIRRLKASSGLPDNCCAAAVWWAKRKWESLSEEKADG